ECTAHANYKQMVLRARDRDTVVTGASTGHPVRVLQNRLAKEFMRLEKQGLPVAELEKLGAGKLAAAVRQGDVQGGSVMAGQSAALVNRLEPAAAIIDDLVTGTVKVIKELQRKYC
ncbi:MAG TPA: enoyl-[acyl-carrier-protein] reductase FabK, partial [Firmicutes bacterium]|nr:enoyl-[acyl-carrier-protein] reductase FabK [Bacillota bacterium]